MASYKMKSVALGLSFLTIAPLTQAVSQPQGPYLTICLEASSKLLAHGPFTPEKAVQLQALAMTDSCTVGPPEIVLPFQYLVETLSLLFRSDVSVPTLVQADTNNPLINNCGPTIMTGGIEINVFIAGTGFEINRQFAVGTASYTGPVLATHTADMSVAGTQLYGLSGTDNALFGGEGFIRIAGTPIRAATFSASVACGYVLESRLAGSYVYQACEVYTAATLIDWTSILSGDLDDVPEPFQLLMHSEGTAGIPCDNPYD